MKRKFNQTGLCVRNMHYMADTSVQINEIFERLIETGEYFTITGGRQFGKTTTINLLTKVFEKRDDYLLIRTSFEGIGETIYKNEETFSRGFLMNLHHKAKKINNELSEELFQAALEMKDFDDLSIFISSFVKKKAKKVVIIIDEVDKSTNNQLFLSFLGLLRDKYLNRNAGIDSSFHSVILAGVHDVKTIKLKIREGEEEKLNSPWNIAADFDIDLSFHPPQIVTLLEDFQSENPNIKIPKQEVADKIYFYTTGYPFLVSSMCKTIHEKITAKRDDKNWHLQDVETAFEMITNGAYTNTLFDSIAKNLQNSEKLYQFIYDIVIDNQLKYFIINDKIVSIANTYSIIRNEKKECKIHNRIFEQRIYDLMLSIMNNSGQFLHLPRNRKYYKGKDLDLDYILKRFQQFFKENYSHKDQKFLEREGRLVFLSYLQPIVNGEGYVFKEPVVGDDRRMDIVITHNGKRYVIELKIWRGEAYHQEGLEQLSEYLDIYSLKEGHLLIFNFNKKKKFKEEIIKYEDKTLYTTWA